MMVIDTNEDEYTMEIWTPCQKTREWHQSAKQTIANCHLVSRFPAHIAPLLVASATSANRQPPGKVPTPAVSSADQRAWGSPLFAIHASSSNVPAGLHFTLGRAVWTPLLCFSSIDILSGVRRVERRRNPKYLKLKPWSHRCVHFKDSTQQNWTQLESSENVCTVGSFVKLSRKSDHIARRSPTATKTVGDSRDLVLFAWPSEISN